MKHFLNKYFRLAALLGVTAAVSLQPLAVYAGPATDGVIPGGLDGK